MSDRADTPLRTNNVFTGEQRKLGDRTIWQLWDDIWAFLDPNPNKSWMSEAACKGLDVNLFFPQRGQAYDLKHAQRICGICPVAEQCAEHGKHETYGIWGGTSGAERKRAKTATEK
jgi:hypothetical protein